MEDITRLLVRLARPTPERHDKLGRLYPAKPADLRWPLLAETAAWTGLRAGELAGLKKADLDFIQHTLTVRRTIVETSADRGGLIEDSPKSRNSRRTIDIDSGLARHLAKFSFAMGAGDYVFGSLGKDGTRKSLRHNQFNGRVFKPAVDELGLGITFHDLRHFHASFLIVNGWSLIEVSRRLGHADTSITARVYSHAFRLRESDDSRRLGDLRVRHTPPTHRREAR